MSILTESKRWGIIKNMRRIKDGENIIPSHAVVTSGAVAFVSERRRVAIHLSRDEADALCVILNSGDPNDYS